MTAGGAASEGTGDMSSAEAGGAPPFSMFVSYRRDDAAYAAGRLVDHLRDELGGADVEIFIDVENLGPGIDFVAEIRRQVKRTNTFIAVIGQRWQRRLVEEGDFVRLELEAALSRPELWVIPVLVEGARPPKRQSLPESVQALADRNAVTLSPTKWAADVAPLVDSLRDEIGRWRAERQRAEDEANRHRLAAEQARRAEDGRRAEQARPGGERNGLVTGPVDDEADARHAAERQARRRRRILVAFACLLVVVAAALVVALALGDGDTSDTDVADTEEGKEEPASPREACLESCTLAVDGREAWTYTDVAVEPGDRLTFEAGGTVAHDNEREQATSVGPDGASDESVARNPALNRPGKGVYVRPPGHGGLIAMIVPGDECDWRSHREAIFAVGASAAHVAGTSGTLCLGINDYGGGDPAGGVRNNSGGFEVTLLIDPGS